MTLSIYFQNVEYVSFSLPFLHSALLCAWALVSFIKYIILSQELLDLIKTYYKLCIIVFFIVNIILLQFLVIMINISNFIIISYYSWQLCNCIFHNLIIAKRLAIMTVIYSINLLQFLAIKIGFFNIISTYHTARQSISFIAPKRREDIEVHA